MLDALLVGFHRPVHHRRRRAEPGLVGAPHDVNPFVRRCLAVTVQQATDAIDQDLGAAAGNAVETRCSQPVDDGRHGQLGQARQVNHLGRRERVQFERRIAGLDGAKEIFIPGQRQVRIVPALEQQLHAADRNRLVDFAEQLLEPEHVPFRRSDRAIERTEVALRHADVRVVDVAIDDVRDDPFGMFAATDLVGETAEQRSRRDSIQVERLPGVNAAAGPNLRRNAIDGHLAVEPTTLAAPAASKKRRSRAAVTSPASSA